jgi:hypothetical protein
MVGASVPIVLTSRADSAEGPRRLLRYRAADGQCRSKARTAERVTLVRGQSSYRID